jgi:4-carboxymuconolactone decarboxylase
VCEPRPGSGEVASETSTSPDVTLAASPPDPGSGSTDDPTNRKESFVDRDETFERGLEIRKEMFGALTEEHLRNADDFTRDLQEMVTTYCFGEVWGREGLPRNIRSMLTLSLLAAQGRTAELKWHVKGALVNGVSKEEIKEVFLHTAVYAGIPAGVAAHFAAGEVFAEEAG